MAELEMEPRQLVGHCIMMTSCPAHRKQRLLHIKKTYAHQKTYRSEGEIPMGDIWLRAALRLILWEFTQGHQVRWRKLKMGPNANGHTEIPGESLCMRPCTSQPISHLNFTYPIREAPSLSLTPRWGNTQAYRVGGESSSNLPKTGDFCTDQGH